MNTGKRLCLWLLLALTAWGCAGVSEKYPSDEAKAYFAAANEANYLGVVCHVPPACRSLRLYLLHGG